MLLSTRNLKMKGIPGKLKKRFGAFQDPRENCGRSTQTLVVGDMEGPPPVFHILLLKKRNAANLQQEEEIPTEKNSRLKNLAVRWRNSYSGGR